MLFCVQKLNQKLNVFVRFTLKKKKKKKLFNECKFISMAIFLVDKKNSALTESITV